MYAESDEHITFTTTFIHGEASVTEEGLRLSTATAAFLGSKEAEGNNRMAVRMVHDQIPKALG